VFDCTTPVPSYLSNTTGMLQLTTPEEDITPDPPQVLLEDVGDSEEPMTLMHTAVSVEVTGRLSRLHEQLRTIHPLFGMYHYTPESKQQSKQWIDAGCSGPKTRSVPSAGKVMASVFWNAEDILFIILKRVKQ